MSGDSGGSASGDAPGAMDARWSQVAQRHYDPDGDADLTTVIVFAVAEAEGVDPADLTSPPLYECVDAAAIEDAFFGSDVFGASRRGTDTVEFRYIEYLVRIRSDGWVQVYARADADSPE